MTTVETTAETTRGDDLRFAIRSHQPALDGLRGLAVAGVLLFHGGHLTGGYLGVDAFFVLSGFLITSLLLAEAGATNRISLSGFWARRARRLLPALGCVLAAVVLYSVFLARADELSTIRGDALATIGYVANWRQIFTSNDYWALFRSPSPLQHTWSLSIEEQFYVLWPLVVVTITRGRTAADAARRILVTACIGAGASFVLMQLTFDAADTSRAYYGTDTRMSSILIGAALAAWLALRGPVAASRRRLLESTAIGGAVLLALAFARLSGTSATLYRGGLFVCALATAALIAAGVHPDRGGVSRALSWRPFRELGLISYGVYLWHWPIFVVVDTDRAHLTGWPLLVLRVSLTILVSAVSFRFVERPIRYGARSTRLMLRATPIVALALVAAIVVSTAGATTHDAAATTTQGGVLLVGDSVAHSLFPGLVRAGMNVTQQTEPGCRLLRGKLAYAGPYSAICPWRQDWRGAVNRQDPEVVLMVIGAWDLFDVEPPGFDHFLAPGSAQWNQYYARQLEAAISLLSARGARVVIPTLPCQGSMPGGPHFDDRSLFNVARVKAANSVLEQVVARNAAKVVSPDLFGFLCPLDKFQAGAQSVGVVRSDGVHYTDKGAALVASFLAPSLGASAPGGDHASDQGLVLIYGDALMTAARAAMFDAVPVGSGIRMVMTAQPFTAVCDFTRWLRRDLAIERPRLVVLETHGGAPTACMRNASGRQIAPGSPAYYAGFARDVAAFLSAAHSAAVPVLVIATPPEASPSGMQAQARLASILRDVGRRFGNATYSNAGRDALGGTVWTRTLPCLADEISRAECRSGRIVVSPFCPSQTIAALTSGCPVYSSGATRYGRAIASAIRTALRLAAPRAPATTTTATSRGSG